MSIWQTIRVFISSTFRDIHAERDHLLKVTFPRLRQWCEERRLHLVHIDRRWGVTEAEANNGKAIDIRFIPARRGGERVRPKKSTTAGRSSFASWAVATAGGRIRCRRKSSTGSAV